MRWTRRQRLNIEARSVFRRLMRLLVAVSSIGSTSHPIVAADDRDDRIADLQRKLAEPSVPPCRTSVG
jgi:hypothetical protein